MKLTQKHVSFLLQRLKFMKNDFKKFLSIQKIIICLLFYALKKKRKKNTESIFEMHI